MNPFGDEPLLSDQEFDDAFAHAIRWAERLIGEKPDTNMPHLFMHYRQWQGGSKPTDASLSEVSLCMCAMADGMDNWEEKKKMMTALANKAYQDRWIPVALFFVAESLTNSGGKDGKTKPFDDPEARECSMVMGSRMTDQFAVACSVPLKRNATTGLFERAGENLVVDRTKAEVQSPLLGLYWRAYCLAAFKNVPPNLRPPWAKSL